MNKRAQRGVIICHTTRDIAVKAIELARSMVRIGDKYHHAADSQHLAELDAAIHDLKKDRPAMPGLQHIIDHPDDAPTLPMCMHGLWVQRRCRECEQTARGMERDLLRILSEEFTDEMKGGPNRV